MPRGVAGVATFSDPLVDLGMPPRPHLNRLPVDPGDIRHARLRAHRLPCHPQASGESCANHTLIHHARSTSLMKQARAVQAAGTIPVFALLLVRHQDMRMQVRILRPTRQVLVRHGLQPRQPDQILLPSRRIVDTGVASVLSQIVHRLPHGCLMHLTGQPSLLRRTKSCQQAHRLRSRERQVIATHRPIRRPPPQPLPIRRHMIIDPRLNLAPLQPLPRLHPSDPSSNLRRSLSPITTPHHHPRQRCASLPVIVHKISTHPSPTIQRGLVIIHRMRPKLRHRQHNPHPTQHPCANVPRFLGVS